jgi:hypothetical protein
MQGMSRAIRLAWKGLKQEFRERKLVFTEDELLTQGMKPVYWISSGFRRGGVN